MTEPRVELRQVSKTYDTQQGHTLALRDVSLRVMPGEIVTILGPSGCGKSTLLNLVAGFEPPEEGEVLIDGQPVESPAPDRLVMFQEGALFPWLRVHDNVAFGLRMQGVGKAERRAQAMEQLKTVGLEQFSHHLLHELSVGMRQRVALARALVMHPRVLLMDEPFAALDAQTRDGLHATLQELWASAGTTTLFVTHNIREAACLGDRVLVMSPRPGTIVAEREVHAERPRHIEDDPVMQVARSLRQELHAAVEAAA
ncbi:MAG: ABC transporter ATP-binding protein [Halobacteriales archaeon]|nr:ABC transporter ATP-binding protein [Halobacteriales archaeon]